LHCGAFYVNLNNDPGNSNWNIEAASPYPFFKTIMNACYLPQPLLKINEYHASVSSESKVDDRIRRNEIL